MLNKIFVAILAILVFCAAPVYSASSSIESLSKIRTSKSYIFKINYTTEDKWVDSLVFKLFCSFSKGSELSFTSSGLNNIKRGWHKTEIRVPSVYRDRYGYITDYRVELYHKGILVSIRSM
ncbi:MAG: hypothetical protein KKC66_01150 [Candidatus Omnitrophica bacterium]|nr:hypothetical protein [Candidatus Omnitrophota bacterium]MBU1932497.1 hypothetical protein [Candidatus Omnitrophota bacterium]